MHGWFRVRATKTKAAAAASRSTARLRRSLSVEQPPRPPAPSVFPGAGPERSGRGRSMAPAAVRHVRRARCDERRAASGSGVSISTPCGVCSLPRLGRGLNARLSRPWWGMKRATSPTTSIQAAQTTKRGSGCRSLRLPSVTSSPLGTPSRTPVPGASDPGSIFFFDGRSLPIQVHSDRFKWTVSLTFLVVQPVSSQPPRKPKELAGVASCSG